MRAGYGIRRGLRRIHLRQRSDARQLYVGDLYAESRPVHRGWHELVRHSICENDFMQHRVALITTKRARSGRQRRTKLIDYLVPAPLGVLVGFGNRMLVHGTEALRIGILVASVMVFEGGYVAVRKWFDSRPRQKD